LTPGSNSATGDVAASFIPKYSAWILLGLITFLRLIWANFVPISLDEAYYASWSRDLAFGYLDHPPGVAWLAALNHFVDSSVLATRALVVVCATIGGIYAIKICRLIAPANLWAPSIAVLLTQCSIGGFALGILLNPDSLMGMSWLIAIHEFILVLRGNSWRWISLGAVIALGLLGKYIMVLFPAAAIVFCILYRRHEFQKKGIWAGIFFGLLLFSPHIWWNANNQWATVNFQLHRGFEGKHQSVGDPTAFLPIPQIAQENSSEFKLSKQLQAATADEVLKKPKPKRLRDRAPKFMLPLFSLSEFVSGQLALWGVFAIAALLFLANEFRRPSAEDEVIRFVYWTAFIPFVFFGAISLITKVEANWAGVHILGLGIAIATRTKKIDVVLVTGLLIHLGFFSAFAIAPERIAERAGLKRIQKEISGYDQLAATLDSVDIPIFADTYQTVSMLRFLLPDRTIQQWPGLARPSELTRNPQPEHWLERTRKDGFMLILSGESLPWLEGFTATQAARIVICPGNLRQVFRAGQAQDAKQVCTDQIKSWLVAEYRPL
jgi:4-amino-4-deoxy-L-arabinose transferase-like glycosyltransferase